MFFRIYRNASLPKRVRHVVRQSVTKMFNFGSWLIDFIGLWIKIFKKLSYLSLIVHSNHQLQTRSWDYRSWDFLKHFRRVFLIPELTKVLFLYIFHWIALHLLLHYLPFKNFAACCCFFITCALNTAETAWMKFVFSCLFTALYSHWKSELI